jgi:hypothetical protein
MKHLVCPHHGIVCQPCGEALARKDEELVSLRKQVETLKKMINDQHAEDAKDNPFHHLHEDFG